MVIAPRPTNANWPSESCPAQPVRTVSESATIVYSSIRLHNCCCDALLTIIPGSLLVTRQAPDATGKSGIAVQANQAVERGVKLLTLEAMKMQSNIYAPITGRVSKLLVTPGQHVEAKDLLVAITT